MNELTRIHLAKVPYEIESSAHKVLGEYLKAIAKAVGEDLASEVEVRITEILGERGTHRDGVIVMADVDAIKAQLGSPEAFREGEDEKPKTEVPASNQQRVFMRDLDHALLGGVAAGLAAFFGVNRTVVRVLFIVLTLGWGTGFLLYLALWLLIPAARTDGDRLRMQGKPINLETLTEEIEERFRGKGERSKVSRILDSVVQVVRTVIGIGLVVSALAALAVGSSVATLLVQEPLYGIFPVTTPDFMLAGGIGLVILSFMLMTLWLGAALIQRRKPMNTYGSPFILMFSIIFWVSLFGTGSIAAQNAGDLRDRFEKIETRTSQDLPEFRKLTLKGNVHARYVVSDTRRVEMWRYPDGTLPTVNSKQEGDRLILSFTMERNSKSIWRFIDEPFITIYGPDIGSIQVEDRADVWISRND